MKRLLAGVIVAFCVAVPASAATLQGGEVFSLPKGQSLSGNLYAAASDLTISGTIFGDALLAGGKVIVDGAVTQDLAAAGGSVDVRAPITGDARIIGGDITISSRVGGDLIIAGGSVHVLSSAVISGDIVVAGGELIFEGAALKDMRILAGRAVIRGIVSGSVSARISESITVSTGASIKGNLDYVAPAAATIEQGALIGGKVTASTTATNSNENAKAILATLVSVALLTKFIVLAVTAALLVHFFRRASTSLTIRSLTEIPKNTILGFAALIVVPIACILLLATVIFSPFGVLGLVLYILLLLIAKLFVGVVAGAQLAKWFAKETRVTILWAVIGVATLELISLIPIIGWIVGTIIYLCVFGALTRILNDRYFVNR